MHGIKTFLSVKYLSMLLLIGNTCYITGHLWWEWWILLMKGQQGRAWWFLCCWPEQPVENDLSNLLKKKVGYALMRVLVLRRHLISRGYPAKRALPGPFWQDTLDLTLADDVGCLQWTFWIKLTALYDNFYDSMLLDKCKLRYLRKPYKELSQKRWVGAYKIDSYK